MWWRRSSCTFLEPYHICYCKIITPSHTNKQTKKYLGQIQSPDFQGERPVPPPPLLLPKPKRLPRLGPTFMSINPVVAAAVELENSSLAAPHLKQLDLLAKLCVPQFPRLQYQSPGLTSGPVLKPKELLTGRPPKPLSKSAVLMPPGLGSLQRWHESLLWKLRWLHDLQFQSPGLFIFFYNPIEKNLNNYTKL